MSSEGSVSRWIDQLKAGDQAAAGPLWERYFHRLVGLARKKLQDLPRRVADEEDVALSVLDSFCRGAEEGRFPHLQDRDNLWQLLVVITAQKASNLRRDQRRLKRGGGTIRGDSALEGAVDQVVDQEPTPEFAAQFAEECRRLLECLADPELQAIARWKMEGDTTEEIAAKLRCAPRTVERRLVMIRGLWGKELAP